jgi:hypothetical protein
MNRIEITNKSLQCFVLGAIGFVPVLGIPAGIMAVIRFCQVTFRRGDEWNPAQRYLLWGFGLGLLSLLGSALAVLLVGLAVIDAAMNG